VLGRSGATVFINPMWDNEAERIGKQRCTPVGYALHVTSDLLGLFALLLLLGVVAYLAFRGIFGTFHASLLWLIAIPLVLAIIGTSLYRISWVLADRRGFHYDYEARQASWLVDGQRQTYKYGDGA
jgi:hypothetical protein